MAILITEWGCNQIFRMRCGSKGVFEVTALTEGSKGKHPASKSEIPLSKSKWSHPTGICELSFETFAVVDYGNRAIRVVTGMSNRSVANGKVQLLKVNHGQSTFFQFDPYFIDSHGSTIGTSYASIHCIHLFSLCSQFCRIGTLRVSLLESSTSTHSSSTSLTLSSTMSCSSHQSELRSTSLQRRVCFSLNSFVNQCHGSIVSSLAVVFGLVGCHPERILLKIIFFFLLDFVIRTS